MTLIFPNPSRTFDQTRKAIRFAGHDGVFEILFYVEADVLTANNQGTASEAECLKIFDALRPSVQKAASLAYSRGPRPFYVLRAADFR
ncbi:DUF1488 family protein [Methylocella sp. CPCC 101449]|uniref:DUF1488 family protein n=1 Tax=Methylocella sp. CPCC 101449 TaxID=2987531 RepID=UPI002891F0F7|nr:DUF1488 family protein [Methylocella sp. CPCC 101449]MDT2021259.1 DUF1488 domain-containing protein [Methylocella sp. CPCC 101449]